jgi:hypothetical protein
MYLCNSRPYFYFNILEQKWIKFRNNRRYQRGKLKIYNPYNIRHEKINKLDKRLLRKKEKEERIFEEDRGNPKERSFHI